jgi:hypothetical protein
VKIEILTAVSVKIQVVWAVTQGGLVKIVTDVSDGPNAFVFRAKQFKKYQFEKIVLKDERTEQRRTRTWLSKAAGIVW